MPNAQFEVIHSLPGRVRIRLGAIARKPVLARKLASFLLKQTGVFEVRVNARTASVTILFSPHNFDPLYCFSTLDLKDVEQGDEAVYHPVKSSPFLSALRRSTYSLEARVPPKAQLILAALSLAASLIEAPAFVCRIFLTASLVPVINRAAQTALEEQRVGADALDAASCTLLVREGYFGTAASMTFLIALGEFIRDLVTRRCQRLTAHQFALFQRSAWLMKGKSRIRIPVPDLVPGDRIVVYAGELIAVEGTIVEGSGTTVPANPESDFEPHYVAVGDKVFPDTVLAGGKLYVLNERTTDGRSLDPVREKQRRRWLQRTRLHRNALRRGYKRVWPVLSVAAAFFAMTRNLHQAAAIICFDFITGIKIAIPTAVLSSIERAGRRGIVVSNATALERLSEVDAVVFARSGVLTELEPVVTDVYIREGFSLQEVARYAAAVEQRYNHLAAYAIYKHARMDSIPVPERTSSHLISGLGVLGAVDGHTILVGRTRLMQMHSVDMAPAEQFLATCQSRGDLRACVAIDGKLAGVIAYKDPLREDVRPAIAALRRIGVNEIAMTTGGSQVAAETLAREAGITHVHYRTLPEDQAEIVRQYRRKGLKVAVVGYDVDDALALEQADVAVTLGTGSDIARYRADVVLSSESLDALVEGIHIARDGMALARQNLAVVSVPNWLGLLLSVTGSAEILTATLLNNGSVIIGAVNGLRPLLDDGLSDLQIEPN